MAGIVACLFTGCFHRVDVRLSFPGPAFMQCFWCFVPGVYCTAVVDPVKYVVYYMHVQTTDRARLHRKRYFVKKGIERE